MAAKWCCGGASKIEKFLNMGRKIRSVFVENFIRKKQKVVYGKYNMSIKIKEFGLLWQRVKKVKKTQVCLFLLGSMRVCLLLKI